MGVDDWRCMHWIPSILKKQCKQVIAYNVVTLHCHDRHLMAVTMPAACPEAQAVESVASCIGCVGTSVVKQWDCSMQPTTYPNCLSGSYISAGLCNPLLQWTSMNNLSSAPLTLGTVPYGAVYHLLLIVIWYVHPKGLALQISGQSVDHCRSQQASPCCGLQWLLYALA